MYVAYIVSWELDLHWSCSVFKSWFQYVTDCDPKSSKPINTCTLAVYNTCHTTKFTLEDSVICCMFTDHVMLRQRKGKTTFNDSIYTKRCQLPRFLWNMFKVMSLAWEEQQKLISTWKENLSQSYEWICQLRTISFVVSIYCILWCSRAGLLKAWLS